MFLLIFEQEPKKSLNLSRVELLQPSDTNFQPLAPPPPRRLRLRSMIFQTFTNYKFVEFGAKK